MTTPGSIIVRGLCKLHPGQREPALWDVAFDVGAGAMVAIVGKSGAGKSTLLRCLSGLDAFDSGEIIVDAVRVRGGERPQALRGRVGLVFQHLELFPHLSVLDNCTLAPVHTRNLEKTAAERQALQLLGELELQAQAHAWPEQLSGGQRQRVAIARALMMEPRVLLYDEPTSALDPELKAEVQKTLRRVRERTGMTQVLVTHDPAWAMELCSLAIVFEAGKVVRFGSPADVL